nr:unnamed protein product [Callosobruchus analis]
MANNEELDIIFYSDNCCGQQKNKFVLSAYTYAVKKFKLRSITHKFLIQGHSQNKGDNIHSVIEKQIKRHLKGSPIFIPEQYVTLIRMAKKTGLHITYEDFYDLKTLQEEWGKNFRTNTEGGSVVKWNVIKVLRVEKDDPTSFYYKTSFEETQLKKQ